MMKNIFSFDWKKAVTQGLIAGFVSVSASAIGMVELFGERYLLAGVVTMGQILIFAAPAVFAYNSVEKEASQRSAASVLRAAVIGAVSAVMILLLVWAALSFDIRSVLINVSPTLIDLLTFGLGPQTGGIVLFVSMIIVCSVMALLHFLPGIYTRSIMYAGATTVLIGLLSQILTERIRNFFGLQAASLVFQSNALQLIPGILIFVVAAAIFFWREKNSKEKKAERKTKQLTMREKMIRNIPLSIILLVLPLILGTYLTEITNNVGIYLLMGLGLNIVVGLAGLLDLGYVAFFAVGAYTMAILTSTGSLGGLELSFWVALPICVAVAALFGMVLGIPVLRMRGDYLAIVTLGFGEIIRILALSDMLKPFIGGAQGILQIPKPNILGVTLVQPEQLYYVILAAALLAAFISNRLRESRIGRAWIAMREDEDVAEAMGINLVKTKLLAFAIGAGFSGLAGAIFAPKLTSIFPHSFNLLISINILALIIVGGLGSIPGTIVGAIILVGLPELLREFAEFRWLIYGLLLVIMMLNKPEGFIPSDVIRRELHSGDEPNLKPTP
jgi:branched-chain amino acid transport system permease protein